MTEKQHFKNALKLSVNISRCALFRVVNDLFLKRNGEAAIFMTFLRWVGVGGWKVLLKRWLKRRLVEKGLPKLGATNDANFATTNH